MPQWRNRVVETLTPEIEQALQDRVLLSMDGVHDLDMEALRELPPWRAVALARVAMRTGDMSREERDALIREANLDRNQGRLRPWVDEVALRAAGSKRLR